MRFTIYLLTPQVRNDIKVYTRDIITSFQSQTEEFSYRQLDATSDLLTDNRQHQYTYDEKFKITANAKKTLSFKFNKKVLVDNNWIDNPFFNEIQINTLLMLEDFYGNQYVFTVTDIKYAFTSINVVYTVSCEDTFSYSTTRENSGYEIDNNADSEDFIGAKTVDWWVQAKIVPDCRPVYQYLTMSSGLYESVDGEFLTFTYNANNQINLINGIAERHQVKRIIKEAYPEKRDSAIRPENASFYEPFMFSCSGSSTNGALVELASKRDLQLVCFEHLDANDTLIKYFWFEPLKNVDRASGLVYSPKDSLASFSLGHSGKSLTTVLNVQGPTYDDEIVSLFPTLPPFFFQQFESQEWQKMDFIDHSFSQLLEPKHYIFEKDNLPTNLITIIDSRSGTNEVYKGYILNVPLWEEDNIIDLYPVLSFGDSQLFVSFSGATEVAITPTTCRWILALIDNSYHVIQSYTEGDEIAEFKEVEDNAARYWALIPSDPQLRDSSVNRVALSNISYIDISLGHIVSEEEKLFAEAADRCPWLENKLIDFSYFKQQNLLSAKEYRNLLNLVLNDLRIINGQLMCYTSAYYNALHQKTRILADIVNNFDSLGAACQADIVDPSETLGSVSNYQYFNSAYKQIYATTAQNATPIYGYKDILKDYFNKYVNANQRFLKNIYEFEKFFNARVSVPGEALYKFVYTINNSDTPSSWEACSDTEQVSPTEYIGYWTQDYYTFTTVGGENETSLVGSNFSNYISDPESNRYGALVNPIPIYKKTMRNNATYLTPIQVVSRDNCTNYYTQESEITEVMPSTHYTSDHEYLKRIVTITINNELEAPWVRSSMSKNTRVFSIYPSSKIINSSDFIESKYTGIWQASCTINGTAVSAPFLCTTRRSMDSENKKIELVFAARHQDTASKAIFDAIEAQTEIHLIPVRDLEGNHFSKLGLRYDGTKQNELCGTSDTYTLTLNASGNSTNIPYTLGYCAVSESEIINNWLASPCEENNTKTHYQDFTRLNYKPFYTSIPSMCECINYTAAENQVIATDLNEPLADNADNTLIQSNWSFDFDNIFNHDFTDNDLPHDIKSYLDLLPATQLYWYGFNSKLVNSDSGTTLYYYDSTGTELSQVPSVKHYIPIPLVVEANNDKFYRYIYTYSGWSDSTTNLVCLGTAPSINESALWCSTANSRAQLSTDISAANRWNIFGQAIPTASGFSNDCLLRYSASADPIVIPDETVLQDLHTHKAYVYDYIGFTTALLFSSLHDTKYPNEDFLNYSAISSWFPSNSAMASILLQSSSSNNGQTSNNNTLYFKDAHWVMRKKTDYFNKHSSYYILNLSVLEKNNVQNLNGPYIKDHLFEAGSLLFRNNANSIWQSDMLWYPIIQLFVPIDISALDWRIGNYTVSSGLNYLMQRESGSYYTDSDASNEYIFSLTRYGITYPCIVFEKQNFVEEPLINKATAHITLYSTADTYWDQFEREWDPSAEADLAEGYYYAPEETSYVQAKEDEFSLTTEYYNLVNNSYQRVYTIQQIRDAGSYYTLSAKTFNEYDFIKDKKNPTLSLYKHRRRGYTYFTKTIVDNVEVYQPTSVVIEEDEILGNEISSNRLVTLDWDQAITTSAYDTLDTYIKLNTESVSLTAQRKKISNYDFANMTNGDFWYAFHNTSSNSNLTLCFNHATAIEAELTNYWNQAYTASKYCAYYLPASWTDRIESSQNTAFDALFNVKDGKLTLLNTILPEVRIFSRNGEIKLNKYIWHRQTTADKQPTTDLLAFDQKTEETLASNFKDNPAFKDILEELQESFDNFTLVKSGTTTYYYAERGGLLWNEFVKNKTGKGFEAYGGLYQMIYQHIRDNYKDLNNKQYETLKTLQAQKWEEIRRLYGHVVVENSYTNNDATTPDELYQDAYYHLLDMTLPERQYSLSINDISLLKGYKGTELRIGDPIELDAESFYAKQDLIFRSLKQYLFISDISYDLRNPSKLAVTVNNIKYGDKLVNRLAKFIR